MTKTRIEFKPLPLTNSEFSSLCGEFLPSPGECTVGSLSVDDIEWIINDSVCIAKITIDADDVEEAVRALHSMNINSGRRALVTIGISPDVHISVKDLAPLIGHYNSGEDDIEIVWGFAMQSHLPANFRLGVIVPIVPVGNCMTI